MRKRVLSDPNMSSVGGRLALPKTGLFRDLPEGSRSLALVPFLSSDGGRLLWKVPKILLASCADGDQCAFPSFVKIRERVLKVRKEV